MILAGAVFVLVVACLVIFAAEVRRAAAREAAAWSRYRCSCGVARVDLRHADLRQPMPRCPSCGSAEFPRFT